MGEERRRRKALQRLDYFLQEFWEEVESQPIIWNWHIPVICWHLMAVTFGLISRLLVTIPPRTTKSRIVTMFWPAWEFARGMKSRFLCTGNDDTLVVEMSVETRRILESQKFKRWFPNVVITSDQNTKHKFDLENGGRRQVTSAGSTATGKGGTRLLGDDIHDANDSPAKFQTRVHWFWNTFWTRKDPSGCSVVLIMQRLDVLDVAGSIIDNEARLQYWTHLNLPLHYDETRPCVTIPLPFIKEWVDEHGEETPWFDSREPGQNLWPRVFTPEAIAQDKVSMDPKKYSAQFEQSPVPGGGNVFESEWLEHRFRTLLAFKVDLWLISVDSAFKDKKTSNYVVFQLWAKVGAQYYCVGQRRDKMNYPKMKSELVEWREYWIGKGIFPDLVVVEDKSNGTPLLQELITDVEGIQPYEPGSASKLSRWTAVTGQWSAGQVLLPEKGAYIVNSQGEAVYLDTSFVFPLKKEHLTVTGEKEGEEDDQVDAAAQALLVFRQRFGVLVAAQATGDVSSIYEDPEGFLDFGYDT